MGATASLWTLFVSSFLAATLLPGGSEVVLFAVLKAHPTLYWPALAAATIGNTLGGIVKAIRLSRAVMRNIRQNLFFAFAYNALGIPIAAGLLYPFFGLLLSPVIAGLAMSLSSVSVIGNALRLRSVPLNK